MKIGQKIRLRSRINQYFDPDLMYELELLAKYKYGIDTNRKADKIYELIKERSDSGKMPIPSILGPGTNRYALLIDGYCFKIAMDEDGIIDNIKEFALSKELYPDVIKIYEMSMNNVVIVCEYVTVFDSQTFAVSKNDMLEVLARISDKFFIGDIGISTKNYLNWGTRDDGSICVLDFAYAYRSSFKTFICYCDGVTSLRYDSAYTHLCCPRCGAKYTFGDIRTKISNKDILSEIDDLDKISYRITGAEEFVERDTELSPRSGDKKRVKRIEEKQRIAAAKAADHVEELTLDEYLTKVVRGEIKL